MRGQMSLQQTRSARSQMHPNATKRTHKRKPLWHPRAPLGQFAGVPLNWQTLRPHWKRLRESLDPPVAIYGADEPVMVEGIFLYLV